MNARPGSWRTTAMRSAHTSTSTWATKKSLMFHQNPWMSAVRLVQISDQLNSTSRTCPWLAARKNAPNATTRAMSPSPST